MNLFVTLISFSLLAPLARQEKHLPPSILFFDGICNLCSGTVNFIFAEDREKRLRVATLQGETAKNLLPKHITQELNSLVLFKKNTVYTKSSAVLRIAADLGGIWQFFTVLLVIPKPIRDFLYSIVAKQRYFLFGKKNFCRLPTAHEKTLFYD